MSDMPKITKTRQLMREKFGFTTNLPDVKRLHDDVTTRNGKDGNNPAYLPVEKFRKKIKLLMGMTTTEEDGVLEDMLDFRMLQRLFDKYGMPEQAQADLELLQKGFERNDNNLISKAWHDLKDHLPYWFLGMLGQYVSPGDIAAEDNEELPENDKEALVNLWDIMKAFNDDAEKQGKEFAKNTPHAGRDTEAKSNLNKAKKNSDLSSDHKAPSDLDDKPENELGKE